MTTSIQPARTGNGRRLAIGIIVGVLLILVALYAWNFFDTRGKVPRGTTVGGGEIGNMEPAAATQRLEEELGETNEFPVTITAKETTTKFVPEDAGLNIDFAATVEGAGTESANPFSMLSGFFTTREVPTVSVVEDGQLHAAVEELTEALAIAPEDGAVNVDGGNVNVTDPVIGQRVEPAVLEEAMRTQWLNPEGFEVAAEEVQPEITAEEVTEVAEGPAAEAVSSDLVALGRDNTNGVIPTHRMGEVVTFAPEDGNLVTHVHVERAQEILDEGLAQTEVEPKNATIAPGGGVASEHVDGVSVNWEVTMEDFRERVVGDHDREWEAEYEDTPAKLTTEMARNATFNEVIGEFTTSGFSANSGTNIRVIANQINGQVVGPDEIFSVNNFTGPRGTAQGYVESGIIMNGRPAMGVGGGISQFATTLYNATYFAGMEDIEHQPHSYYISRYPAGREATLAEGAIDLAFRNTSPYPIRIDASVSGNSVTVQIKGVKTVEVESIDNGRWAHTQPSVQNISSGACQPSSGIPGFTTSNTRIIRDLSGAEIERETYTWTYDPQPIVRCG